MTTDITTRPILFSGAMVRAILDGRKTQTRRLIKPQPTAPSRDHWETAERLAAIGCVQWHEPGKVCVGSPEAMIAVNPYGRPGDRLWVRETWRIEKRGDAYLLDYAADPGSPSMRGVHAALGMDYVTEGMRWRPSIFMPRWASRLTLELTDVRVQRLHDISEEDCLAEGVSGLEMARGILSDTPPDPRWRFIEIWNNINGKRAPWASNPWVWALSFTVVEP